MDNTLKIKEKLEKYLQDCELIINEPLKNHTTFKVGGTADLFAIPNNYEDIIAMINFCKKNQLKYYILGNGSNVLVRDGGFRGLIIKTSQLNDIKVQGEYLIAQCGAELKDVAKICTNNSMTGFEFASGIPGSIGGAIAMNAGAYNGEMKDVVEECVVIDNELNIKTLSKEELELSYRNSAIQKYGYIALEVKIKLDYGDNKLIEEKVQDLTNRREEKQPLEANSAGSTFKRAPGHYTGKLIQDSGLKGYSIGGAQISNKHAGFVINKGDASANDILNLIGHIQKVVKENYDVDLEPEVRIIGEE
ncbi:UDP-N-acetylmuramate dehydrogenase [Oceanirhabdus sp. W0125-5]|uniref:UDP-N-acetylmuramate dehydrogenase n=1 Tax=Oceanirhabdus sp. W0125-5 TaxID=2999116 RepID=UPI0022F3413D|nr:UDP-N-acetylmuramate dehydrogenase [Oceanirhabdus sp. W0125-5]WBW99297.1 UDP-N-acetylmuramate dehydrogenase [Oceanirhabdus sp. W0125-5]